jgi:hypothetical protein
MSRKRIIKYWQLPVRDKFLLLEAAVLLHVAAVIIWFIPLRWYARPLLGKHMDDTPNVDLEVEADFLRQIGWAAQLAGDSMPWRIGCFARAVAVKWMLGRRGLVSVLYLGARTKSGKVFRAHAWLRCGTMYLAGGDGRKFGKVSSFV